MQDFIEVAQNFGVAAAVLVAVAVFLWRVLNWLKPWAEKLFTAHLTLVGTLNDTQKDHRDTLNKMADTQERQTGLLVELKDAAKANGEILSEMRKAHNAK